MTERERQLDELARVFIDAALDALLQESESPVNNNEATAPTQRAPENQNLAG